MKLSINASFDPFQSVSGWVRDVSGLFPGAGAIVAEQVRAARATFSADPVGEAGLAPQSLAAASVRPWKPHSLWLGALAGVVLAAGSSAQSQAASPVGLAGRWDMAAENSEFEEAVVGPAPDQAVMMVTRDDADHLSYELVERRSGVEVARGAYDLSFKGGPSVGEAGGHEQAVVAAKDSDGAISIVAGGAGSYHAVVRLRQTGPDTALIEHVLAGPQGEIQLERFAMVRREEGAQTSTALASPAAGRDSAEGGN